IDSLVQAVLMDCAQDAEDDLRDQLTTMSANLEQKKAQRAVIEQIAALKDQAQQQMRAEFNTLTGEGLIDCSFDDFSAARPIAVAMPALGEDASGAPQVT